MVRVLVVIDNLTQYERIRKITEDLDYPVEFDFKHSNTKSSIWNHKDFVDGKSVIDINLQSVEIIKNYDLVISVHCYQFFKSEFVNSIRCINVHPGYNPINRGWYPQVFSIINDLDIGATIHEMDEKLDNGPIIARALVEKKPWDTSYSLYHRVLEKEVELFEKYLIKILENSYSTINPESGGNFFTKRDFEELCFIDLNQVGTFNDFYNRLRALSFDGYENAYFFDKNGNKIFIKLEISTNFE